jgi:C1A family cysteine protease
MLGKVLLLTVALFGLTSVTATRYDTALLGEFNAWQIKHRRVYDSVSDFEHAMNNFIATKARVEAANKRSNGNNWAGITKFADLSPAEFKQKYLRAKHTPETAKKLKRAIKNTLPHTSVAAPTSFDWRTHKPSVVTPVKDQGQCGSCWAFSTTESVESMWALAGNSLAVLSPEQIVDCDTVDQGCNGGDTPTGFEYVTQAGGLESESAYPYTAGSGDAGNCQFDASSVVAKINNFTWAIPECTGSCDSQSMSQVQSKLATTGPFAICVYAEPWQDYSGGIFNDASCTHAYTDLDHCVQMVGYTPDYWLVRNSWAADWGEAGYIYVSTKEAKGNLCGVLDEVNFANAAKGGHKKH